MSTSCLHHVYYYISYTTPQRVCCISALIAAIFTTAKSLPDFPWYRCSPHGGMKGINANPPPGYFVLYVFHLASRRDAPGSHLKCSSDGRVVGLTLDFVTLEGSLSKQLGLALGTGQKSPKEHDVIFMPPGRKPYPRNTFFLASSCSSLCFDPGVMPILTASVHTSHMLAP